jgi:hypothetical protein
MPISPFSPCVGVNIGTAWCYGVMYKWRPLQLTACTLSQHIPCRRTGDVIQYIIVSAQAIATGVLMSLPLRAYSRSVIANQVGLVHRSGQPECLCKTRHHGPIITVWPIIVMVLPAAGTSRLHEVRKTGHVMSILRPAVSARAFIRRRTFEWAR